jgi:hypothetical protein
MVARRLTPFPDGSRFVEGGNLALALAAGPMPGREAARLVEVLARAMQLAHSRNMVHHNLKPANPFDWELWRECDVFRAERRVP